MEIFEPLLVKYSSHCNEIKNENFHVIFKLKIFEQKVVGHGNELLK